MFGRYVLGFELDAGGVFERSRKGLRDVLLTVGGPWGVELAVDKDLDTVHFSISAKKQERQL